MSRSNRYGGEKFYKKHQAEVPRLGDVGFAVIRNLVDMHQLDEVLNEVAVHCGRIAIRPRGLGQERPYGVTLLEQVEAASQSGVRHVPVREAMDAVYEQVPALRHAMKAVPQDLRPMGRRYKGVRSLAITFDNATTERLKAERQQILEVIEELADVPNTLEWYTYNTPHVSLVKIPAINMPHANSVIMAHITESRPESIDLKRATFFSKTRRNSSQHK